ncbi:hypothetical protein EYF80_047648 [Liparis tanakae]|uniref:Uncharacterized protein n=1 Tax=Liparis tanakae TaxID=230148 RepID=A0A4Z2FLQ0_9TELE|nr:hypothetical protein EYF80_047648 [Liparis tanakae]
MSDGLVQPDKRDAEDGVNLFRGTVRSMSPGVMCRGIWKAHGSPRVERWDDAQPTVRYLTRPISMEAWCQRSASEARRLRLLLVLSGAKTPSDPAFCSLPSFDMRDECEATDCSGDPVGSADKRPLQNDDASSCVTDPKCRGASQRTMAPLLGGRLGLCPALVKQT